LKQQEDDKRNLEIRRAADAVVAEILDRVVTEVDGLPLPNRQEMSVVLRHIQAEKNLLHRRQNEVLEVKSVVWNIYRFIETECINDFFDSLLKEISDANALAKDLTRELLMKAVGVSDKDAKKQTRMSRVFDHLVRNRESQPRKTGHKLRYIISDEERLRILNSKVKSLQDLSAKEGWFGKSTEEKEKLSELKKINEKIKEEYQLLTHLQEEHTDSMDGVVILTLSSKSALEQKAKRIIQLVKDELKHWRTSMKVTCSCGVKTSFSGTSSVSISADGRRIAIGSMRGDISLWTIDAGGARCLGKSSKQQRLKRPFKKVSLSVDRLRVLTVDSEDEVRIYTWEYTKKSTNVPFHKSRVFTGKIFRPHIPDLLLQLTAEDFSMPLKPISYHFIFSSKILNLLRARSVEWYTHALSTMGKQRAICVGLQCGTCMR